MRVGIKTGQGGYSYDELSQVWQKSEELGFESAWLYDHFIALGDANSGCLEAYTTLGALTRDTKRLRIGVMVTCAGYRNPAYLAKITSTLDVISSGRLILGIGAGWYEAEYKSYGYPFPSASERVGQMRETIQVLKALWSAEKGSFKGRYFNVEEALNYPKPVQKPIPIWVGITSGTKTMPAISVREADGFNSTANSSLSRRIIQRAEDVRREMGRSRESVTYSAQKFLLTGTEEQIREIVKEPAAKKGVSPAEYIKARADRLIIGTPEECAERLREYTDAGIDYLVLGVTGDKLGWPLEIIKDELLPLL
jgi:alkanesulfonate monooxygenase SsuD/methylene tetrahydromethanopterin reductase-like flavin-dependent oxidoreductase (luciferase family)